jgi:GT2 family glycosyltransferase
MPSAGADDQPRVSVVIPNWNGIRLLRPCLDSLRRQTYRDFEVIVVDNASCDDSVEALEREYPEVRVLALDENIGYAGGCNAGIRAARGAILVMLNNDTEADPGWLQALVDGLARHPEAGSASSRLMIHSRPEILNAAGDLYQRNGLPDSRGVWQPYGPPYDQEAYVFGASGGAAAYRREMLDEVGLFEERFFMWCEDVDLAWRAQRAGYQCLYVPDAVVYHHLSATGGGALSSYYVGRNTLWVLARHYPCGLWRRHWRAVVAAQWGVAREALRAWRGAAARARLRGQLAGLLTSWRWLGYRRAQARQARVDDAYLESILS